MSAATIAEIAVGALWAFALGRVSTGWWPYRHARVRARPGRVDRLADPSSAVLTAQERDMLTKMSAVVKSTMPRGTAVAGRTLADMLRQTIPGVDDVALGRMALVTLIYGQAAQAAAAGQNPGDTVMDLLLTAAAVDLTELERTGAPPASD